MIKNILLISLMYCQLSVFTAQARQSMQDPQFRSDLADDLEPLLRNNILDAWYPVVIDQEHGGYLSRFSHRWQPEGDQQKMIVTLSRHIWTTSTASLFFNGDTTLAGYARHGFSFLKDVMWDQDFGGFYTLVSREGNPLPGHDSSLIKEAYGNSFAIYALAAFYETTGEEKALQLAKDTFRWLERHSHDTEYGGYFQFMERDGTVILTGPNNTPPKDQNSSIHLLEAFTGLYRVWPDSILHKRTQELIRIIRDTIRVDPGYLNLFFTAEWQPISYRDSVAVVREERYFYDHVSFGHDVETAYLLLEAEETLSGHQSTETLAAAKLMVDHALRNGWDTESGGFYDGGYYMPGDSLITILRDTKNWWAQAEGLNTLLIMEDMYPDDPSAYGKHFLELWNYIRQYLIDHEYGGWFEGGIDKQPEMKKAAKAHIWKGNYHNSRAMMNIIRQLRHNPKE
jgi:cellobiose epimerase